MKRVTYAMNVSLDGYTADCDGGLDWGVPDPDVFQFWIDRTRRLCAYLMGRRLYEAMLYWETAQDGLGAAEQQWASLWRALPKVVFSTRLTQVRGNARLATGSLGDEVARLRSELATGDIAVGGATLAGSAAELGLIDEYQAIVHPVLLGGGLPFFPRRRTELDLEDAGRLGAKVVCLRYRVK